ncbi:hypothetical protein [Sphingomonas panacisoli]|uniref:hypothetical protein n=1 Tax=Sphingomonas panacisoli TaxID=1813879 RepID=UPI001F02198F|nr:hypothetical protein [Sphingomonas panacisoli]
MRRAIASIALALAGCSAQPVRTGGIVSTNPCADQLLLALVPPERVAAISHYSQEAAATSIPLDLARRFRGTAGTAEEVVAMKPDLVLASSFTPASTLRAYQKLGLKVLLLDLAHDDRREPRPDPLGRRSARLAGCGRTIDRAHRCGRRRSGAEGRG